MNKMYAIANITGITVPPPPTPPSIIGTIYVVFLLSMYTCLKIHTSWAASIVSVFRTLNKSK